MTKILVTGATGFIGNYVITQLLLTGKYSVIATSCSTEKARNFGWFKSVKYMPFNFDDFNNDINYYDYFGQPDQMIHLAWQGLPNYKAAFHLEKNLPLQFGFLQNCIGNGLTDITVTGTCFEYGMQEGCLSEEMEVAPANAYAIAKNELRLQLAQLQLQIPFNLKWVRLFYMFGNGQSPNSLLSQLEKALENGDTIFNMSGGEQERDYLPVENVAENIVRIALQNTITGVINCCSGKPVKVKDLVQDYLVKNNQHITLNLGFYPYSDFEPMIFWGNTVKLKTVLSIV